MRTQVRVQGFLLITVCFCLGLAFAGRKAPQAPPANALAHCSPGEGQGQGTGRAVSVDP